MGQVVDACDKALKLDERSLKAFLRSAAPLRLTSRSLLHMLVL
jgi:hypothetical protein